MSTKIINPNSHLRLKKLSLIHSIMAVQMWSPPYLGQKELTKRNVSKQSPCVGEFYKSDHFPFQGAGLKGWQMSVTLTFLLVETVYMPSNIPTTNKINDFRQSVFSPELNFSFIEDSYLFKFMEFLYTCENLSSEKQKDI